MSDKGRKFKVLRVDHIGVAVKDMEKAKTFYTDVLGMTPMGEEVVESQKVKVCFYSLQRQ